MNYGQQLESLKPMHNLSKSSNEMSPKKNLSWQKYGEIFLTRDLMSVYVCSACATVTAQEPSMIMGNVNAKHFITSEVRKFWLHVQQCHGDKCLIANFRKEQLMVQNVIVIEDDDDDDNEDEDKELELKKQHFAVSATKETAKQNHKKQKEAEDSGSILVSLLQSKPHNLNNVAESPTKAEEISMDYLTAEDDIISKQFSNIENQLREMHGDVNEKESPVVNNFQAGLLPVSKQSLEDELKTKPFDGIYAESKRKDLDNSIDENNVDLNMVMESEEKSIAMNGDESDTIDYFYKNDDTIADSTISKPKSFGFGSIVKERSKSLEKYLGNYANNQNNNKNNEPDNEIIELSDCDEEEVVKNDLKAVRKGDITAPTVPADSQIETVKDTSSNNNNNNINNYYPICPTVPIDNQIESANDISNSNNNNNDNYYPICPPLCEQEFEDNLKVMEHSEHQQKHTLQSSQTLNQSFQQMYSHTFPEQLQQNCQSNNSNNQSNNQNTGSCGSPFRPTSPHVPLQSPLYEPLKCNYCEQTFSAFWQKWRHETLHFKRRRNTAYNVVASPTTKITQRSLRPFKCPTCGRRTNTPKNMLKHMQSYHPDINIYEPINIQPHTENSSKTFQCQHCSFKYKSKQSLTTHIKRIHADLLTTSVAAANVIPDAVPTAVTATAFAPCDSPFTTPLEEQADEMMNYDIPTAVTATAFAPCDSPFTTPLEEQADEMMNYHCRWHMESSYQPAWSNDSNQDSMESIGTLLPAGCESET